ncbi:unnamed protein product [Somion occarium]|uniref:Pheromone n=1 Tax=Somion occarium TaxID=3059160 RepID=A0ABP1CSD5_9APHY
MDEFAYSDVTLFSVVPSDDPNSFSAPIDMEHISNTQSYSYCVIA